MNRIYSKWKVFVNAFLYSILSLENNAMSFATLQQTFCNIPST